MAMAMAQLFFTASALAAAIAFWLPQAQLAPAA
jgi:hypothetical protein